MKLLLSLLTAAVLCTPAGADELADRPIGAFGRKFIHRDGTYTLSAKQGDKTMIVEETYNKNNIMIWKRIFQTDSQGRLRNGVIYDGKKNAKGSIYYGYDKKTDQIIEERQFNNKAQLVRRVFYPGALKDVPGIDPRVVNSGVAIVYDPDRPDAKPVQEAAPPPTTPVTGEQQEFTPGIPVGRSAPSFSQPAAAVPMPEAKPADGVPAAKPGERKPRSFLPQRGK